MAYVPTNWVTGDIITAVKLNNIENGIVTLDTQPSGVEEIMIMMELMI